MKVDLDDLIEGITATGPRSASGGALAAQPELPPQAEQALVSVRSDANTCDLHGQRVEAAIDMASRFRNGMVLRNEPCVDILYGHGTGLKTAIRQWLPRAKQARCWRPTRPHEDGDAFTFVALT